MRSYLRCESARDIRYRNVKCIASTKESPVNDSRTIASDESARAKHQAIFDAWRRENREKKVLSTAKWTSIALFLLPFLAVVAAITWYVRTR